MLLLQQINNPFQLPAATATVFR